MRFQIPLRQIVEDFGQHDRLLRDGFQGEVLFEVGVLGEADSGLLGGVATLPITTLFDLDVVCGGAENLGLVEVVVTLHVRGGLEGGAVGTDEFNLDAVHVLTVVLVADVAGEREDDRAEEEVVDVVAAAAALTVGGEVALREVRGLGLRVDGLVLVEDDADFVTGRVDGDHQVLGFAELVVLVVRHKKVEAAEAGMAVGGEVELLFVAPSGEHLLAFGINLRSEVGDVGELGSLLGTGSRIEVVAALAAGFIGGEPDGEFIVGDERMDVVVGGVAEVHDFGFTPGFAFLHRLIDVAALDFLLVLRAFGEVEHGTLAVGGGFALVDAAVERAALVHGGHGRPLAGPVGVLALGFRGDIDVGESPGGPLVGTLAG